MNDTGFDHFETILPKRATGYSKLFIEYTNSPYLNMDLPYAAGSMYSTVEDLYKWDQALYEPGLLSQESLELFFKPHVEVPGGHYAYGWFISEVDVDGDGSNEKLIRHGGGINGFNTLIVRVPAKGQLLVLLNNTGSAPLGYMSDQIFKIINNREYEYPKKGIGLALYEKYEDGGIDEAIDWYKKLKESELLGTFYTDRAELNSLGYYLMNNKNDLNAAEKIFELNMNEYPDWFNAYDSYAEALMNQNKNEAAIEYYKKSLEMNPGNDNAVEKLKELGVEYNKEFKVPVEILQSYTGTYELMPNFKITIRLEDEQLLAKATGQPEFPIFPMSETKFYYKVVEAQIEFIKNEAGEVESLILYQGGKELPGKKIE
jgi:tetratricopeptide (TPR) repeat protein